MANLEQLYFTFRDSGASILTEDRTTEFLTEENRAIVYESIIDLLADADDRLTPNIRKVFTVQDVVEMSIKAGVFL